MDDGDNVVAGAVGSITLSDGEALGLLLGTTSVELDQGVAVFDGMELRFDAIGEYVLAATYEGLPGVESDSITISGKVLLLAVFFFCCCVRHVRRVRSYSHIVCVSSFVLWR